MKKLVSLSATVMLFAGLCTALVTPAQAAPVSTKPITIDTSSQSAVRDAYNNYFVPNRDVPSGWSGGSVGSCQPGTTTDAFRTAMITTVNYYRALAGLPSVVEDGASTIQAQQAALMMDAKDDLTHEPDSSWPCYTTAGATGANNSNLALTSGAWSGTETFSLWMSNQGNPNVGHRNAILYPPLGKVGIGQTPQGGALLWMASPLWTNTRVSGGVSWPSPNYFPYENVPDSGYWSYSQQGVDFSSKTVTVTKNGVSVSGISYGERTNLSSGHYPDSHIVWKMPTLTAPAAGATDVYHVTISGVGSYDVKVFSATATSTETAAIQAKYTAMGGASSYLGAETAPPGRDSKGVYKQTFRCGVIYWSAATGAQPVYTCGAIGTTYVAMGGPTSYLGYPTAGEGRDAQNVYKQTFQNGNIYWSGSSAVPVYTVGGIGITYLQMGGPASYLGYPTAGEGRDAQNVYKQTFESGILYWSSTGAQPVYTKGAIGMTYLHMGGPSSYLGYPTGGEGQRGGSYYQPFQYGRIVWGSTGISIR